MDENGTAPLKDEKPQKAAPRKRKGQFLPAFIGAVTFLPRIIKAGFTAFFKKRKIKITTKATIIYGIIFTVVFALASALIIVLYRSYLGHADASVTDAQRMRQLALLIAVIYPIAIALVLALGYYVIRGILEPVKRMTDTAKAVNTENLSTRMNISGNGDEIDILADMLNQMLDSLQIAYEKQMRFVSDASHELRTPIAVVQGYSGLLKRWGMDNKEISLEAVEAIDSESNNMKNLVEKLLFLARADKKTLTVKMSNFFINELVEEIVRETRVYVNDHDIEIGQIEAINIDGDRELIKQLLRIFLDNSIKYTPIGGKITLSCYEEDDDYCALVVTDNGIGIAEEDLPHIFERFFKCDKARVRDGGSTGLGLSIAKWIADNHNAEITVSSSLNIGTTFMVLLPKAANTEESYTEE